MTPKIIDDDNGTITAETPAGVVRTWFYQNREEQRRGMWGAREFAEGWFLADRANAATHAALANARAEAE